jgi:hypothetical protein
MSWSIDPIASGRCLGGRPGGEHTGRVNAAQWMFGDILAAVGAWVGRLRRRVVAVGGWVGRHRGRRREYDPGFAERLATRRRHVAEVQSTIPHFDQATEAARRPLE